MGQLLDGQVESSGIEQVGVCPVEQFYVLARPGEVDPVASVRQRVVAGERAVAAGFSALRVVVDATSLVQAPAARVAFAQLEYLVDVDMSRLPIAAMCAYDASRVEARAVAHLASLHPLCGPGLGMLRVYADGQAGFALAGEADASAAQAIEDALERSCRCLGRRRCVSRRAAWALSTTTR